MCVLLNLVIWCVWQLWTVLICVSVMICDVTMFFALISFSLISVLSSLRLGNNHSSNRGNSPPTPSALPPFFVFPFLLIFHSALASLMLAVCIVPHFCLLTTGLILCQWFHAELLCTSTFLCTFSKSYQLLDVLCVFFGVFLHRFLFFFHSLALLFSLSVLSVK